MEKGNTLWAAPMYTTFYRTWWTECYGGFRGPGTECVSLCNPDGHGSTDRQTLFHHLPPFDRSPIPRYPFLWEYTTTTGHAGDAFMKRWGIAGWAIATALIATCLPVSAESNLWISYYFAGEQNYAAGEHADGDTLLRSARAEAARDPESAYRLANTLDALGRTSMALDQFEQAEQYFLCALELKENALGPNSRFVPPTLNNLGDLYLIMGDEARAECRYRRALDIHERDQWNVEVCRSLNGMALIHARRDESVHAEELLKRAISIHERHQRRWHPWLATARINLGNLYTGLGRLDEAEELFEMAAYAQSRSLEARHPDVALRLYAQAALFAKIGDYAQARELDDRAEAMMAEFTRRNRR